MDQVREHFPLTVEGREPSFSLFVGMNSFPLDTEAAIDYVVRSPRFQHFPESVEYIPHLAFLTPFSRKLDTFRSFLHRVGFGTQPDVFRAHGFQMKHASHFGIVEFVFLAALPGEEMAISKFFPEMALTVDSIPEVFPQIGTYTLFKVIVRHGEVQGIYGGERKKLDLANKIFTRRGDATRYNVR